MNFYSISAILAFITGFTLVLISYIYSKNRHEVKVFLLVTILATIWTLCPIAVSLFRNNIILLSLVQFLYIFVVFIPPAILHIMLVVSDREEIKYEKYILRFCYFISFIFIFFVFTPLFIKGINLDKPYFSIKPGIFYNTFSLYFIILGFYGFTKPITALKTSKKGSVLIRSKYFFIGGLVGVFSALLHFSAIYLKFEPFPHDFLLIGYFIIIAYAIIKYRLMDIRLVISKSILYFILILFVALSFTFVTFTTGQLLGGKGQILITLAVSLVIVIFLDPLKKLLAKWTDFFFYKGKIDYQGVLRDISEIISSELDLQKLVGLIEENLTKEIKTKFVQLYLLRANNKTNNNEQVFVRSDSSENLGKDDLVVQYLLGKKEMIITEELLRQKADAKTEAEKEKVDKLQERLDQKETGLVVPIMVEDKITAIFLIGQKLSGSPFSQEEINFFDILAPQVATALEKSKLFEEVQAAKVNLEQLVEQRTQDLKERNRYLVALQSLINLITRSLDFQKVMQTIADGIAAKLGFIGGLLSFINFENNTVQVGAITNTPLTRKVLSLVPLDPKRYANSLDEVDNLGIKAIKTKEIVSGNRFYDFIKPALPALLIDKIQQVLGAKSFFAVPVYSEEKVIGVIDFVLKKEAAEVTDIEKEMMKSLADQVGIVYRNLTLYQKIQQANIELKDANIRLQQLDKSKSEFLSIASHQLRTPLTGIKGYLSMMLEGDFGQVPNNLKTILQELFENTDRLTRLVNVFLNVSRIESGRFELELKNIDLVKLIDDVVVEFKPVADKKNLKLNFKKPAKLISHVTLDKDKVKDVLVNLIDNSIKYTLKGKVEVFLESDKKFIKVTVKDTGIGIKKDEVNNLFRKFVRGEGIAQIHTGGSGLGLYIAKNIVEAHGGKIWAESEGKGKGAAFIFTLPTH